MAILQSTVTTKESLVTESEANVLQTLLRTQQLMEGLKILSLIRQDDTSIYATSSKQIELKILYLKHEIAIALEDLKGIPSQFRSKLDDGTIPEYKPRRP